jgi:DNA-binding transcriptional regulator YhcF (GntR family)
MYDNDITSTSNNCKGFVMIDRSIVDNDWYSSIPARLLYFELCLRVTHSNYQTVFNGNQLTLKSGEFVTTFDNLANLTKLTIQQVRTALKTLINYNVIDVEQIGKSRKKATKITLKSNTRNNTQDNTQDNTRDELINDCNKRDFQESKITDNTRNNTRNNTQDNTIQQEDLNNKNNNKNIYTSKTTSKTLQFSCDEFVELFNSSFADYDIPSIAKLTDTRKKALVRIAKEFNFTNLERWVELFEFISESKFLTGQTEKGESHTKWRMTIDWLLKPANFIKVTEGQYHG